MRCSALITFCFVLAACVEPNARDDVTQLGADALSYWPDSAWRTTIAQHVGVDSARLANLLSQLRAGAFGAVDGIVVVRKGYLIAEEYFGGWNGDSIHQMQSVTKSVTSIVTGIAIGHGEITSVDQLMIELLDGREAPDDRAGRAHDANGHGVERGPVRRLTARDTQ